VADLAAVARLPSALRVGELALDRAGKVVSVWRLRMWLRLRLRAAVLDALDLGREVEVVLRGALRSHVCDATVSSDEKPLARPGKMVA
jgi:hypothetical protein